MQASCKKWYSILGIGICFMFSCFYLFVAIVKVCRREQLSCLFQSAEESEQVHEVLEIKRQTNCQIQRLNKKSYVLMQESYFVVENKFDKENVKIRSVKLLTEKARTFF